MRRRLAVWSINNTQQSCVVAKLGNLGPNALNVLLR